VPQHPTMAAASEIQPAMAKNITMASDIATIDSNVSQLSTPLMTKLSPEVVRIAL